MATESRSSPVVLIANPQEWAARSLESILRPAGYTVVQTFQEHDTLRAVHEPHVDAVILDSSLGEDAVLDLCRVLRADPTLPPTLPILVTTAGTLGRPQTLAVLRAGANDAWGQPLDTEALLLRLERYVAVKRAADAARQSDPSLRRPTR